MGRIESAHLDVGALLDVAGRYDAVAETVDGLARTHLAGLRFDGAVAGRDYTTEGDVLRRAMDDLTDGMQAWARAAREIASALRSSANLYVDADARGAVGLG
jgi:hypothetical protein